MPYSPATDTLGTLTRKVWLEKKIYDQTLGHLPVFGVLYSNDKKPWNGGIVGTIAVQVDSPASSTFISGFDPIPVSQSNTKREVVVNARMMRNAIEYSYEQIRQTAVEALASIVEEQLLTAANQMRADLEYYLFNGQEALRQPAGLQYAVDDGGLVATYLQLNRTTYPNWKANVTTAATTLSWSALESAHAICIQGKYNPDLIVTTRALRNAYAALVQPQYRIVLPTEYGQGGYEDSLIFNGYPIMFSDECQTNHWYTLNTSTFRLYVDPNADFHFTKPLQIPLQEVWYQTLRFDWALACVRPRANHKYSNITP